MTSQALMSPPPDADGSAGPPARSRLGFGARLAGATSTLVVLVCVAHSWLLARHDLDDVRGYLADRGRALATQLARDSARALGSRNVGEVQRLVEQARASSGVVYARVIDQRGLLLAAAGQRPETTGHEASATTDADTWEFGAPIASVAKTSAAATSLGTVEIGLSVEPIAALQRRRLATGTAFAMLSALLGIAGATLLARAMTGPLRALVAAADRIRRGDFGVRVQRESRDDVGRLAAAFNAMAESLAGSRAALEQKVCELERADHLKSEFLATVSHELRTPLNVILGYTEMLAGGGGGPVTATQAEMIAAIDRYSRNQLALITSVLDFTRLTSGKVSVQLERFALGPLLHDVEVAVRPRLRSPAVALTVTTDADVAEVQTDRVKLEEIVRNLLDNAVKFTDAGTITVHASRVDERGLAIEVADTGRGIPADEVGAIFDAFHQVGESSTRSTGGVGLGLSIVRQLAQVLGGSVTVTSTPGVGSRFRVLLPDVVVDSEADARAALAAAAHNTTALQRGPLRAVRRRPRRAGTPKAP